MKELSLICSRSGHLRLSVGVTPMFGIWHFDFEGFPVHSRLWRQKKKFVETGKFLGFGVAFVIFIVRLQLGTY